jgi:hypothetical protein
MGNFIYSPPQVLTPTNYWEQGRYYCFSDIDHNGYNDIIFTRTVNFYIPNLEILFNDGNGNFLEDPITKVQRSKSKNKASIISCYPNPVYSEATVEFELTETSYINLVLIDISGKPVRQLVNGKLYSKGTHTIPMVAEKNTKGVYFIKLEINNTLSHTIKIIII